MAGFTYDSRRKLTETWVKGLQEKGKHLSDKEKEMLPDVYLYTVPQKVCGEIRQLLEDGVYKTLSSLYKGEFQNLVNVCICKEDQEEFYYALDQMNQYQMTAGWYRRSLRSGSYAPFAEQSVKLLRAYTRLAFYQASLSDVLTGNLSPELYDHARNDYFSYAQLLAAQIDRGNEAAISAVKDILLGEGNTAMMSHELIRGIVMSKNEELYEILGKFLLAAKLQEGVRQAVCETMDAGRPEAFLYLFSVIKEHNLIRYSSVKRAAATWIGIFNENSVERISEKLLQLMDRCLLDEAFCNEQLFTEDSVAISCALWAKGFYDAQAAVNAVLELIAHGTKHQKMTASYFLCSLESEKQKMEASKDVIFNEFEDLELVACFLPFFMESAGSHFYRLAKDENDYSYGRGKKPIKPKHMAPEELFADREEAKKSYVVLKEILKQVPKKGVQFFPCIFPWHQASVSPSAVVVRLCLIAWMLNEEELLDEAAGFIPLVGQGERYSYYSASRAIVASVLLYRPKTEARKNVLFELLHNAEEDANEKAFQLADDMELSEEDFIKIEKNLKYKKGRTGTLALLRKQKNDSLVSCIGRLLKEKSEEYHMGALDLALQLKKQDKDCFAQTIPYLKTLKNPTGKERVLLDELLEEQSAAEDILNTPGYGLYDVSKEWILPSAKADKSQAQKIFIHGEDACELVCKKLDELIKENNTLSYKTAWKEDELLGNALQKCRFIQNEPNLNPLDEYPFREMWEEFYHTQIKTPEFLLEIEMYHQCCVQRKFYEKNTKLYQKVFGKGILKKPPFQKLSPVLSYISQVWKVISLLYEQFVPDDVKLEAALSGIAKFLSVLDTSNDLISVSENRWNEMVTYTRRASELPIFSEMIQWLSYAAEEWKTSFVLRFGIHQYYLGQEHREMNRQYSYRCISYLNLSDFVRLYVEGIWDKDLFYKAVFEYLNLGALLAPISIVKQRGAVSSRNAGVYALNSFFGNQKIKPVDGKYRFEEMNDLPEMIFAHELYKELIPLVLNVELKRGEQPTPFSDYIRQIQVIYGIDYMIQILTALGKDPLQRGYSYYTSAEDRKSVLNHLLKVSMPKPDETAADLKKALLGTDISKKRLVELAMYAQQWIPMLEKYLKISGFASACYYFMAHTSEQFDEQVTSVIAKYTPLSVEELTDGAFDIQWFFEAYRSVGEKNFKLLYDAAKYSSTGAAHARARKYADAALGNVEKENLKSEISAKRNKDLLMSIGLLPLPTARKKREEELFDRYQFIQNFKKESRQFGAQRRANEGRAAEIALCNLSVNAGFSDVTRLILRMETKLVEQAEEYFSWKPLEEIELVISVDETGKSALLCRKDGKQLKSIPAKYKKNETVKSYQQTVKKLKEQYSRTKQMMEQAMEDKTPFEVWEFLQLYKNPVVRPIVESLAVIPVARPESSLGFLTEEGMLNDLKTLTPLKSNDKIRIVHPFDFYQSGRWHEFQKLLFEKQIRQPFKQVFRELYLKLDEELEKEESMLFSGNQIWPKKTVGALRTRRWIADYEDGLQKIYYKENIVACIYAMADWFTPSDIEAPTLEWVVFSDRKTGKRLKIKEIPDVIYSEVMRDVDLAVSVAYAGGVDSETSHSTIEMRKAIAECNIELFQLKNVRIEGNHAVIDGKLGQYSVHLGSGIVHQIGNSMLFVVPVHSQHRGRIFLPFVDDDPKTAEIMSKILLFAEDTKIKDPNIITQIK